MAGVDIGAVIDRVDVDAIVKRVDLDAAVSGVDLGAIVGRLDLNEIANGLELDPLVAKVNLEAVVDRLDIAAVVAKVNPDPIVARVNFDAALAQIDLIGIAQKIVDGIDLPGIIRDSTGSLASEAVQGVRVQGQHADDAVGQLVGRVFRRRAAIDGPSVVMPETTPRALSGSEQRPAGIVTRVAAMGVDIAMVVVLGSVIYLGIAAARLIWSPTSFSWPTPTFGYVATTELLLAVVYLTASWATTGRSYGASLLGLRVLTFGRRIPGWPLAFVRAVFCVLFPVGLFWVVFSPARRSIQDVVLRTVVVYDWHGAA